VKARQQARKENEESKVKNKPDDNPESLQRDDGHFQDYPRRKEYEHRGDENPRVRSECLPPSLKMKCA
jgi:hypothetical protein